MRASSTGINSGQHLGGQRHEGSIFSLVRELCGDRVEYRALADVTTYVRGITYKKSDEADSGEVKVLRSNNINVTSNTLNFDDVRTIGSHVAVRPNQWLRRNDILMSAASGSRSHVGKIAFVDADIDFCFGGFMAVIRSSKEVEPRFLFHVLTGRAFADYLDTALSSSTINNLNASLVGGFSCPIPPLPVQEEIIRILDTFTELEAALEAELEARTTQYEETRNRLMVFDDVEGHPLSELVRELCPEGVPVATLGSLGEFFRGGSFKKDQLASEGHPAIHYGEIYTKYRASFADALSFVSIEVFQAQPKAIYGDLLFAVSDVTPNNVGTATTWVGDGEIALGGDILAYRHGLNPKYLSYFVKTDFFQAQKRLVVTGGTVRHISAKGLSRIRIYVPPLTIQEEIVRILDTFDSLVGDLSSGLPGEIAARRKQYEHYRDKLLSFEDVAA